MSAKQWSCFGSPSVVFLRELPVDLLQMIPDNHILLAKLCAFHPGNAADIDQLHERVSVRGESSLEWLEGSVHRYQHF